MHVVLSCKREFRMDKGLGFMVKSLSRVKGGEIGEHSSTSFEVGSVVTLNHQQRAAEEREEPCEMRARKY